jgi:hypothetical protein
MGLSEHTPFIYRCVISNVIAMNSQREQKVNSEHFQSCFSLMNVCEILKCSVLILSLYWQTCGAWGGIVVKALRYESDSPGIDPRWCHWIFQWHISFRPHRGPGVDSAPSENEYQEHFLRAKVAGVWGWQPHHLHVPNVMKIWGPKPHGTLWATPGPLRECFNSTSTFYWRTCKGGNTVALLCIFIVYLYCVSFAAFINLLLLFTISFIIIFNS